MAEKTRSISCGDNGESTVLEFGQNDAIVNIPLFHNITSDNCSVMNVSQISATSTDSNTHTKANLNITHNIGGVSIYKFFYALITSTYHKKKPKK